MSNDKDFDRLFQQAFENWSFEPSEEGVHKMATKLNAMENSRLDQLFMNKLKSMGMAVSEAALKRMQWLLFWRKHRALLSGSAILLLFSVAGLAWFSQQNKAYPPAEGIIINPSSGGNSTANETIRPEGAIPAKSTQVDAGSLNENYRTAPQVDEGKNNEVAADPVVASAPTTRPASIIPETSAQTAGETRETGEIAETVKSNPSSQTEVEIADASGLNRKLQTQGVSNQDPEIQGLAAASDRNRANQTQGSAEGEEEMLLLAENDSESGEGEGVHGAQDAGEEAEEEEVEVGENDADTKIAEGEVASDIPAAPWRSFKPLNWHYSATAGMDAGVQGSSVSLTPHVGFRVARLINPLVSLNSGIAYLQRTRINEALHYTDTVYLFGMELQQREAHPIRMHFVEIPLFISWQFAPGQFAHFGASASFAVLHEVEEVVHAYTSENTLHPYSSTVLKGAMSDMASWDASVKLGYAVRFNHRWGAEIGGTWGLRDMTQGRQFQGSHAATPNRNLWINTKLSYQLNRIK